MSDRRSGASNKLFLNLPIQFYLNHVTNLHQLTSQSKVLHHTLQHGDRVMTIDCFDVTSPYLYSVTVLFTL